MKNVYLFLLALTGLFWQVTNGQVHFTESFENPSGSWSGYYSGTLTFPSGDWDFVAVLDESAGDSYDGNDACRINDDISGASITTPSVNGVGTVSFYYHRPFGGTGSFELQKSVAGGAFTTLATVDFSGVTSPALYTFNVNDASNDIKLRILNDDNTAHLTIDLFEVGQFGSTPSPALSYSNASGLTALNYVVGSGPSAEGTVDVGLTNGDGSAVDITAPTNFSISTTSGGPYSASLTDVFSSATADTITIYVIQNSGNAVGSYSGDITTTGGGATSVTQAISGAVTPLPCLPSSVALPYNGITGSAGYDHSNSNPPTAGPDSLCGGNFTIGYVATPNTDQSDNEFGNQSALGLSGLSSADWGGVASFKTYPIDVSGVNGVNITSVGSTVGSTFSSTEYLNWWYSLDGGAQVNFGTFGSGFSAGSVASSLSNLDVSAASTLIVGFTFNINGGGQGFENMDVTVTEYVAPTTPSITMPDDSLVGFTYQEGSGPSASQGSTLAWANILNDAGNNPDAYFISSPSNITDFELELIGPGASSGFQTYAALATALQALTAQDVFKTAASPYTLNVRLAAGLSAGTYRDTIVLRTPLDLAFTAFFNDTVILAGEVTPAPVPCAQLFISEYGESGSGKYVEIYNPTASAIDLSNYEIWRIFNAGTWPESTFSLSGTLASGDVYTIVTGSNAPSGADLSNGVVGYNGNDAVGLAWNGGSGTTFNLIDAVGEESASNPADWDVAGVTGAGSDNSLIRKATVQGPNDDWTSSAGTNATNSEWTVVSYSGGTPTTFGSHTSDCITILCNISAITAGTQTACVPATNTYTQEVTVTYSDAPATGTLDINGQSFAITTSPQTVVLVGLTADGTHDIDVVASFSDEPTCTFTEADLFDAPASCVAPIAACSELFISEVIDGTSSNKCIELYNPTGSVIDLSNYNMALFGNGSPTPTTGPLALAGSIQPYSTWVLCNSGATATYTALADSVGGGLNSLTFYNGDDDIALFNGTTLVDYFGQLGVDPGSGYSGGGVTTQDVTLVRMAGVQAGDNISVDAFDPSVEWTEFPQNDQYLGMHNSDCAPFIWTGSTDTDWNTASNWSKNAIPTPSDAVLIPSPLASGNYPLASANLTVEDLTIAAGASLTIAPSYGLIIGASGSVTNNGTITLQSNGTSTAWLDDFTNAGASYTGDITVETFVSGLGNDFHYFGSPVNGAQLSDFNNLSLAGSAGQVVPLPSCDPNSVDASSPYGNVFEWNENGPFTVAGCDQSGWYALTGAAATNTKGFAAYINNGTTISVTGAPNTGAQASGAMSNTTAEGDGWHLLSNPYPSPINADGVTGSNLASPSLWITSGGYAGTYQGVAPGASIAVMQGFFARVASGSETLSLDNTDRVAGDADYRNGNYYDMQLTVEVAGNGFADVSYIYYNNVATTAFDIAWDREKRNSNHNQPTLYTTNQDGRRLSYNAQNNVEFGNSIPMGLEPGTDGAFTFTVNGVNELPNSSLVYLEDKATGVWTNLRETNSYTFNMLATDNFDRFEIHFTRPIELAFNAESCEGNDGSLTVDFGNQSINGAAVNWTYNVSQNGAAVATGNGTNQLALQNLTPGIYNVELMANNHIVTEQIEIENQEQTEALFTATETVEVGEEVLFENESVNATSYAWLINNENFASENASYTFTTAGTYTVLLEVNNDDCADSYSKTITVTNKVTGVSKVLDLSKAKIYTANNELVIDISALNLAETTDVSVYNLLGQLIAQVNNAAAITKINMEAEANGYYVVRVINGTKSNTKKVLLSK